MFAADLLSWDELIFASELKTEEYLRALFGLDHERQLSDTESHEMTHTTSRTSHTYVAVDDVLVYVDALQATGGRVIAAPEEIPGFGRMCEVIDPSGTRVHVIDRRETHDFSY